MKHQKSLNGLSHWLWFFILLTIYSCYDYFEHITREDSIFSQEPGKWLLFTLFSHVTLLTISYGTSQLLGRWKILPELVCSMVGVALACIAHLSFFGPLWDKLFWFDELYFNSIALPAGVAVLLYLIYRGLFYLIARLLKRRSR
ncbi:MAG: hypothetical protein HRT61_14680 [Ekhidna sp.]|nr:hypothetical protein [Ekhidna sp.]